MEAKNFQVFVNKLGLPKKATETKDGFEWVFLQNETKKFVKVLMDRISANNILKFDDLKE
jgi:hypothetical protein